MEFTSTASIKMALALLLALFAIDAYRVATQPITLGEAIAFDRSIRPPIREILARHDAGIRVLESLLVKRSVGLLRLSEFSFRLPALLGAAFFLWAVYRVVTRVFGQGPLMVVAAVLLSLNPLLLDDLSARHGYVIALAFWTCALDRLLRYLDPSPIVDSRNLNLAGLFLALSVAANLAFVLPALALAIVFLLTASLQKLFRWPDFLDRLVATSIVTAFVLLVIPLTTAVSGTVTEAFAFPARWPFLCFLPPMTVLPLSGASTRACGVPPGPGTRVGAWRLATHIAGSASLLLAALLSCHYLITLRPQPPEPAAVKSVVQVLRRDTTGRHVRVQASPALAPIVSFYRARYRLSNWELTSTGLCDYYVLDAAVSERLKVLYRDGSVLLARPAP
jgi:hypothetical protein